MPRGLVAWGRLDVASPVTGALVAATACAALAACDPPRPAAAHDAADIPADVARLAPDAEPADASPDASPFDAPPGIPDLQFVANEMTHIDLNAVLFHADDCEVIEGCVGAEGRRTLLRFDTVSANRGTADLFVGAPPPPGESNDLFEWSPCHMHHHVKNFARYELLDASGVVLTARKQAFCLEDGEPIQPGIPATGYSCMNQGITRGWADSYSRYLPCQWIDVTGLPSGSYTLRVVVNPLHTLPESNYDNNTFTARVQF